MIANEARIEAESPELTGRRRVMALCAEATQAELAEVLAQSDALSVEDLRRPEIGLVMAQGRIGGTGAAFNLGEVSVARAAIRLAGGETGFAYHLGRDRARARLAATVDALWQRPAARPDLERALRPIAERLAAERVQAERRTAATRVNFFTLVRGED